MEAVPRGGAEVTTIARVAQEAGVGVGTVSRVINGSSAVSEATRRRVLEVIAELGYEPNATARALSTGQTNAVGVIAPFFTEPSVTERLRGVSPRLAGAGYQLILFDLERPEQRDQAFRSPIGRVDGLLSISLSPTPDELERLAAAAVPLVLVDQSHDRLPTVTIDDVEGGRLATEHLLELGHERIGFAGDQEDGAYGFTSSSRRRTGYEQALAAAGHRPEPELERLGGHGRAAGAETARRLLDRPEPPTAIFATSDLTALGVLEAAEELGVRVPEDLSVVGFDDIEVARYAGLTTIAQPLRESGAAGVELLLEALAGGPAPSRRLPLELVVRGTTAHARTGRSFAVSKASARIAAAHTSRVT
jgi:LacI family transcriptional regulator/LacI family repressor for deo operon, udp, cdd, tsx, nupC, and nupG